MTPDGILTTLYSFCAETNCTDGANPYSTLVQATDGNFYGLLLAVARIAFRTTFTGTPVRFSE